MLPSNENRQHNYSLVCEYICKCIPAQEQEKKNMEHQSISCLLAPFLPLSHTHTHFPIPRNARMHIHHPYHTLNK